MHKKLVSLSYILCLLFIQAVAFCQIQPLELEDVPGNIEGKWQFATDPFEVGEIEGWYSPEFDDSGWTTLNAPGYWEPQGITDPRPGAEPQPLNGMPFTDYDGVGWYRLRMIVPEKWQGKKLLLHLGSVDDEDETYLNGQLLGSTGLGVERAVLKLRDYVIEPELVDFGRENLIAVRVKDGGGPGGLMGPMLTLLPQDTEYLIPKRPADTAPFTERFVNPPASSRILKIIHNWPDEDAAQNNLMRMLLAQGFGGVVSNVNFDQYLESEEHWAAYVRAVTEAKKIGMALWLYDEQGYPSGTAGPLVLQDNPEWEARGLLIAEHATSGNAIDVELPPGEFVSATAYAQNGSGIDLADKTNLSDFVKAGRLQWTPPAGEWKVIIFTESFLYENTHAAMSLAYKRHYINLLMPEPTKRFIELTHDNYAQHLGPNLGQWFHATFTDEPSLMSCFWKASDYRPIPWSPQFAEEFKNRRGYDLTPKLALMVADSNGEELKLRHDFWQTVSELVSENYFGQIQKRCQELGVPSGGHLLIEEGMLDHVCYYGDLFRCVRHVDAPSIDCLTSVPYEVPWYIARLTGSVADLRERPLTMSEASDFGQTYRPEGDDRPVRNVTEAEIRGALNRQMLNGINTITSYYTFNGLNAKALNAINDYVGRVCTTLRGGNQVTDIALTYPVESVWQHYIPARSGVTTNSQARKIDHWYTTVRDSLWANGRDCTFIDPQAIVESKVVDGKLVHGNLQWRVVILPGVDTLPQAAWERLAEFTDAGGILISAGLTPRNASEKFASSNVISLGKRLFGEGEGLRIIGNNAGGCSIFLPDGSQGLLNTILDKMLGRDVSFDHNATNLHATHRKIDGQHYWMVINDSATPWEGVVSLCAKGTGEKLDPMTGEMTPVADPSAIPVQLPAWGSMLFNFAQAIEPMRLSMDIAGLPEMKTALLPAATIESAGGTYVDKSIITQDDKITARGLITKSDVDVFLFLTLRFDKPLDIIGKDGLIVTTEVPATQQTGTQLLVMLVEESGALYVSNTGRALSTAGRNVAQIPIGNFQQAGWAPDPDGKFDLDKIVAINVGWGGYFGKEGETVEFTLDPLEFSWFE